jgi:hypothetical protein
MASNTALIYHERQSKELCALHALNNVFQSESAFTQVGCKIKEFAIYLLSKSSLLQKGKLMVNFDI